MRLLDKENANIEKVEIAGPGFINLFLAKDAMTSIIKEVLEEKEAYIQFDTDKNTIKNWTMTSGSLMHLNSFIEIGGFDEKMFIAHLDIDLGIKIHEINKSIIVIHDSILNQHFW